MPVVPDTLEIIAFHDFAGTGFRIGDAVLQAGGECLVLTETAEHAGEVLNCMVGLQTPVQGRVSLLGRDLGRLAGDERLRVLSQIGIVPRDGGLLTGLSAAQNILLPRQYRSNARAGDLEDEIQEALRSCEAVGEAPGEWIDLPPDYLSQYQRRLAGFLRLRLCRPAVCLYESLLGNLHARQKESLLALTREFHQRQPGRTSVYLECDPGLLAEDWPGLVLQAHP
jgi:ABC-type lipoprotein export system ATPase subunit